jgi:hypothetical protein
VGGWDIGRGVGMVKMRFKGKSEDERVELVATIKIGQLYNVLVLVEARLGVRVIL